MNFNLPALPGKITHPPDVMAVIGDSALQTRRTAWQPLGQRPKDDATRRFLNGFQDQFVRRW